MFHENTHPPQWKVMNRWAMARYIAQLDPEREHCQIVRLLESWQFTWDITRALEFALLRTFSVPSISSLLAKTGEFSQRTQRRYDDTSIIMREIMEYGYDDPRGSAMLQRMNQIHARYRIANGDFLYVLSTFHFEPVRWIRKFAWRPFTAHEEHASWLFWRNVGVRMGIQNIPTSAAEFEDFNRDFENTRMRFSETNQQVAEATRRLLEGWFPGPLRPLVRQAVHAMADTTLAAAIGFPVQPTRLQEAAAAALRLRGFLVRLTPSPRRPNLACNRRWPTHPNGYAPATVGPPVVEPHRHRDNIPPGAVAT